MSVKKCWLGDHPENPSVEDSWWIRLSAFEYENDQRLPLTRAKVISPCGCALLALELELPGRFPKIWGWAANRSMCPLPMDDCVPRANMMIE